MTDAYLTIKGEGEGTYTERRSRFLAFAHHAETVDEVKTLLSSYRKRYYDARHVCYAYMLGAARDEYRCSDDGEPSGTAGRPILAQINARRLTNTAVFAARYYGGVNLGTGRLIAAYRAAASLALDNASIEERVIEDRIDIAIPYMMENSVMALVKECGARVVGRRYDNLCRIAIAVRRSNSAALNARLEKLKQINEGKKDKNR